jgi:hypothetical protein
MALLLGLAACGSDAEAPGEAVPALAAGLTTVDRALVEGDHEQARSSLDELVTITERSRGAGRISDAEAERILAAVARLIAALPASTPTPVDTPTEPPEDERDEEKDERDEEKKDEEEKDDDDGGNGHSSENGPDDGHGN